MADVLDIVHRLTYESNTNVLEAVNKEFGTQIKQLQDLKNQELEYKKILEATSAADIKGKQVISALLIKTKRQYDELSTSLGKSFSQNERLTQSMVKQRRQFDSLSFSISNLLRDAPYGFIGIANNIGPALDALIFKLNELKEAGKPTNAIFKEIGLSLFGLVGIINLAILGYSLFRDRMANTNKEAKEQKNTFDELVKSLDNYAKVFSDVANYNDEGTEAIKRNIEAVKAQGVVSGQVFASEKNIFNQEQELRKEELKNIQTRLKIYETVQNAIRLTNAANTNAQRRGSSRQLNVARLLGGLPEDERAMIEKEYAAGTLTFRKFSERVNAIREEEKNKSNEITTQEVAFNSKLREAEYNLRISLTDQIASNEAEYQKMRTEMQTQSSDTILHLLDIERRDRERILDKQIDDARKNGILTAEVEREFYELRMQIRRDFETKFNTQNIQFFGEQIEAYEKYVKSVTDIYTAAVAKNPNFDPLATGVVGADNLPAYNPANAGAQNAAITTGNDRIQKSRAKQRELEAENLKFARERQRIEIKIAEGRLKAAKETGDSYDISIAKDNLKEQQRLLKDLNKDQRDLTRQYATQAIETAASTLQTIYDMQLYYLDKEIQARQERVNQAVLLAEKGNTEILESERNGLIEAQNEREKIATRQLQINALLQASSAAIAATQAIQVVTNAGATGDPYTTAARIAAAVAALAAGFAFVTNLTQAFKFKDGVIDLNGPGNETSDSIPARLSRGESVMTAKETKAYKPFLEAMRNGSFDKMLVTHAGVNANGKNDYKSLEKRLDRVADAVENIHISAKQSMDKHGLTQVLESHRKQEADRWR